MVDDDGEFLAEMRAQLAAFGAEVLTADSPAEAVWMLEHAAVNAVVCDLVLAEGSGSGIDLLEAVRQRWPAAARVLLTGHGERLSSVATSPAAQAVIAKPCEVSRLADLLMHLPAATPTRPGGAPRDPGTPVEPGSLRAQVTRPSRGMVHIAWSGDIAEDSSFVDIEPDATTVVFDLAEIHRINSVGVHRLCWFLEQLPAVQLVAVRCSPAFVGQLNLVPSLGRRLNVQSVYVPLECPNCDRAGDALVVVPADGTVPAVPPRACPACAGPMETAVPEYLYFAFLSVSPGRGA